MAPTTADPSGADSRIEPKSSSSDARRNRRRIVTFLAWTAALTAVLIAGATWLGFKAKTASTELQAAVQLVEPLKSKIATRDEAGAFTLVEQVRAHTGKAKSSVADPLWAVASVLPGLGPNFSAIAEVSRTADDVATLGLAPLAEVYDSLDWESLIPSAAGADLTPLELASPKVSSAAYAVRLSSQRLDTIDVSQLLPEVAAPLTAAREELSKASGALDTAANAAAVIPRMLGSGGPRSYLLVIQNNAEVRASGGIPGALAVVTMENGKLTLGSQNSAVGLGVMSPVIPVDAEQQGIYSGRMGKFMQDVNLTPDFPTAAATAQAMWERKTGQRVDGVISVDPVALSNILDATGAVRIQNPDIVAFEQVGLPLELNGQNLVETLLSDVYAKIEAPGLQDIYFAGVAQEVFLSLSSGKANSEELLEGINQGAQEGRILVWSSSLEEQAIISKYRLSGSIAGSYVSPAEFGVYFNDGTGAKMDYYVKRTVQLVKECPRDGYEQTTVRVISTNTAPVDAATSLPAYVTGNGNFGVPPGSVRTNLVAYGPVQANVETVKLDGQRAQFAPFLHSNRPVGVVAVELAPGESRTVDFTFGEIVQHTEPNLVVTPTVQPVKDVILPTEAATCG